MSETPDDQAPTDPWGKPLPPDQWPQQNPPPSPPAPQPPAASRPGAQPPPEAQQPGYARPDYGQYPPAGEQYPAAGGPYPAQNWSPQPYAPQGYAQPGWGAPPKTEGMAIGALVSGILGTLCGIIGCFGLLIGPVGVVLGVVSRRRIRESGGMTKGEGLALAGLVLGIIGTVASVGWLIAFATVPELRDRLNQLTSTTTTGG